MNILFFYCVNASLLYQVFITCSISMIINKCVLFSFYIQITNLFQLEVFIVDRSDNPNQPNDKENCGGAVRVGGTVFVFNPCLGGPPLMVNMYDCELDMDITLMGYYYQVYIKNSTSIDGT